MFSLKTVVLSAAIVSSSLLVAGCKEDKPMDNSMNSSMSGEDSKMMAKKGDDMMMQGQMMKDEAMKMNAGDMKDGMSKDQMMAKGDQMMKDGQMMKDKSMHMMDSGSKM